MLPKRKILNGDASGLEACASHLRNDELVAVPTETVYGLAGNALSIKAVRKIFDVKGRPLIDPLITHYKSADEAFSHVQESELAEKLASEFWPGPLTMVLEKLPTIPDLVTAGLQSAAIRVPSQPLMRALLHKLDFPLAAPSANPFGYVSPTRPEHVSRTLGSEIAAILDGGSCQHGIESTVLDLRDRGRIQILRPGPICAEKIESLLGLKISCSLGGSSEKAQASPGQLSKHYSPKTQIYVVAHGQLVLSPVPGEAIIANKRPVGSERENVFWLSENGDLKEVARNFFDLVQKLDHMPYTRLSIEMLPQEGLGIALNDRLQRAAAG